MTRKAIKVRLDKLEHAVGKIGYGMAIYYEGEATASILSPKSRRHQEITLADFEAEYPEGVLIEVSYVETEIPD